MHIEERLPHWAQRTNPHVWRNLSHATKHETIDVTRLRRAFLISVGVIITFPLLDLLSEMWVSTPLLVLLTAPIIVFVYTWLLGTLLGLPIVLGLYGLLLTRVSTHAATLVLRERETDRLTLLRTVPTPLRGILLSQIAASIWQEIALLSPLLWAAAWVSLPPIILTHVMLWFEKTPPLFPQLTMLGGLLVSLVRPWLELVMAGALGTFVGTITHYRISARVSAALLLAAYFVLVNLPRLLLLTIPTRLLVEMILPLVLPVLVTWLALAATERALTTD